MDDSRLSGRRVAPALGGDRAGAAANEEDEVGGIDDGARLGRAAVRADDACGERVLLVDRALAADAGGNRGGELLRQFEQFAFRLRDHHATATDENRRL